MSLKLGKSFIISILLLFSHLIMSAQNEISLPYSFYGIGELNKCSNGLLDGMGGTSYAMQSPYYINFRNPASYAAFDSLSMIAETAASIYACTMQQSRTYQKNDYASAAYITLGLPVTQHWRTSVGLLPFSKVGYYIENSNTVENIGTTSHTYFGSGGLNQLYWGNAFRICKGLSIGLNASYMFGSIYKSNNTYFDGTHFYNTFVNDAYHLDGIYLTGGLQYGFDFKENHNLTLGIVYSNTAYIWAKEKLLVNTYSGIYSSVVSYDTVVYNDNIRGNVKIPQSLGGGLSYTFKKKMTIAADVTWNNWEKYTFMGHGDSLKNSIVASMGLNFIPDPTSTKFLKRMNFRLGGKYSTGEFFLRDKPISELAVSLGVGIPLTSFNTHSTINVAFEYGRMGTLTNNLIRRDYFRFLFSFTLQEKWYQRMKIN